MLARGDDDHEVRRGPPRAVGAVGLPVREVRRLDHHRHARARHVELDRSPRWFGCCDTFTSGSGFFATWRASDMSARCHAVGPSSVSGRSSASGSSNHGTARHSHGLRSSTPGVLRRRLRLAFALPVRVAVQVRSRRPAGTAERTRRARPRPRRSSSPAVGRRRGPARSRPAAARDSRRRVPSCRASRRSTARPSAGDTGPEIEVGRRAVREAAHGVRRLSTASVAAARKWYGRGAGGLVVEALHRADPPVGPVREQHERERRAVPRRSTSSAPTACDRAATPSAVSMNARYSGYDFFVASASVPPS